MKEFCISIGPPSAPVGPRTTFVVDDLRPGFAGHAVIGLEWSIPEEGNCSVDFVTIRINLSCNCAVGIGSQSLQSLYI